MKIIIIDDDCLVTEALKTILQINADVEVVAVGLDGNDACRLYREYRPDVLLMDIRMKGMSGLEASEEILKEDPDANILLLTTFLDDEYIIKALKLGGKRIPFEAGLFKYSAGAAGSIFRSDCIRTGDHDQNPGTDPIRANL